MPPDPLSRLFIELKRRRVLRVVGAYLVAGFVLLQVADLVVEPLGLPDWTMTLVIVLLALGLVLTAVLAWAFELTPEGPRRATPAPGEVRATTADPGPTARRPAVAWLAGGLLVALVTGAGYWAARGGDGDAVALDRELVAVLPFDVSAADASLQFLREGAVVLLNSVLTGDGGPRAADTRAVLSAWERHAGSGVSAGPAVAEGVARDLGAGQVLTGEVVAVGEDLVLTGRLEEVGSGAVGTVSVRGPTDSLPALIERLAAGLLSTRAGEAHDRITALQRTPLPAVQAYLEGQAMARRANYGEAVREYSRALEIDSTFALAALAMAEASGWAGGAEKGRALEIAWRERHRLSPRDRALLETYVGTRYPEPPTAREVIGAAERAVRLAPDRPEARYQVADLLVHYGRAVGHPDVWELGKRNFERTLAIDSSYPGPLQHLFEIAVLERDSAGIDRWGERYLRSSPDAPRAGYIRLFRALALGELEPGSVAAVVDTMSRSARSYTTYLALQTGAHMEAGVAAQRSLDSLIETSGQRQGAAYRNWLLAIERGRPAEADSILSAYGEPVWADWERIWGAIFGISPTRAARSAAARIEAAVLTPDGSPGRGPPADPALCALGTWKLANGDTAHVTALIDELHRLQRPDGLRNTLYCALVLEAMLEPHDGGRPGAHPRLDRLDSALVHLPPVDQRGVSPSVVAIAAYMAAELFERYGETDAALAAIRRRIHFLGTPMGFSAMDREEGRLAALVGDRTGAIRAYRRYLDYRADPEPGPMQEEAEAVRQELARLLGDG